jgi:hypothetical protein
MKTKALSPMGSMHPVLFFAFVYVVALLLSVFIFSSLFYSCNAKPAKSFTGETKPNTTAASAGRVAYNR